MSEEQRPNGTQGYRLGQLEAKMEALSRVVTDSHELRFRVSETEKDITSMSKRMDEGFARMNRALWVAVGTFTTFTISVFTLILQNLR